MGGLVPLEKGSATRETRTTERALAQIEGQTQVGLARIEQEAELQVGQMQAVSYVGKRAMHDVALIGHLEQQLSSLVPMATSRL